MAPLNDNGRVGKPSPVHEHLHRCPWCLKQWVHAPERACLAGASHRCPPCTEQNYCEPEPMYGWVPKPEA